MSKKLKTWANLLSLVLAFAPPGAFALSIFLNKLPPQNVATWGMVLLLDGVGLILAYNVYKKKPCRLISEMPFLQLGWAIAAVCIMVAVTTRTNLSSWGWVEIVSLFCCAMAVYLWVIRDAQTGLYPYMLAMYIAFIPQFSNYLERPQPETWWLWVGTVMSAGLAIYASEKRDLRSCFVPWGCIPLNIIGFALVMR